MSKYFLSAFRNDINIIRKYTKDFKCEKSFKDVEPIVNNFMKEYAKLEDENINNKLIKCDILSYELATYYINNIGLSYEERFVVDKIKESLEKEKYRLYMLEELYKLDKELLNCLDSIIKKSQKEIDKKVIELPYSVSCILEGYRKELIEKMEDISRDKDLREAVKNRSKLAYDFVAKYNYITENIISRDYFVTVLWRCCDFIGYLKNYRKKMQGLLMGDGKYIPFKGGYRFNEVCEEIVML